MEVEWQKQSLPGISLPYRITRNYLVAFSLINWFLMGRPCVGGVLVYLWQVDRLLDMYLEYASLVQNPIVYYFVLSEGISFTNIILFRTPHINMCIN